MKLWYGGGITSKSLSDIPDNIKSMLGQYSKLAILKFNPEISYSFKSYTSNIITINTNLEFIPKYAFVKIRKGGEFGPNPSTGWITSTEPTDLATIHIMQNTWKFSKEKVEFDINSSYSGNFSIVEIFLIG